MQSRDTPSGWPPSSPPSSRTFRLSAVLDELAATVVEEGTAPVAALGWAARLGDVLHVECGGTVTGVFDLASITKSFTAVAIARSGLSRTTRLAALLPELARTASADATLEQLVAHRAGLVAHLELFAPWRDWGQRDFDLATALQQLANARRGECDGAIPEHGFAALYSDLGPILAGAALARHLGVIDAGAAIEQLVVAPLGLACELGTARALGSRVSFVPTETTSWRSLEPLSGVVHDENAMVLTGLGGSGHAGMFGTVSALLHFGMEVLRMLEGAGPLACAEPPLWLIDERPGSTWRAGFDGKSAVGSSASASASARTFGHLGFTGTSLWIDPERQVATVLLCNRVAPSRDGERALRIKRTRPRVHEALWALAGR